MNQWTRVPRITQNALDRCQHFVYSEKCAHFITCFRFFIFKTIIWYFVLISESICRNLMTRSRENGLNAEELCCMNHLYGFNCHVNPTRELSEHALNGLFSANDFLETNTKLTPISYNMCTYMKSYIWQC